MKVKFFFSSLFFFVFILGYSQKLDTITKSDFKQNASIGLNSNISKTNTMTNNSVNNSFSSSSPLIFLGTFFLTLGFLYFTLYLFYKIKKENLFYSIFVTAIGLTFFLLLLINVYSGKLLFYLPLLCSLIFFTLYILLRYLFVDPAKVKFLKLSTIVLIIFFLLHIFNFYFSVYLFVSYAIMIVCAAFTIIIRAVIKKKDGAWIIGIGVLAFLFLISSMLLSFTSSYIKQQALRMTIHSSIIMLLAFFSIVSIPLSMAIYLARSFAKTNNNLQLKLIEVENLSAKTIEQEKEKQKILETQKEVLEVQVKERTHEILEQKKIIEEKNKDITDSINYAKRIQDTFLPAKELKYKIFSNAFVFFKPKDIVSGDFYWFTEKNGKRIIAACDCTGHGVPGALMSMIGNNILNQIINENGITSPDEILNQLNIEVRKALKQGQQSETKDGMDIALLTFNSETEIEYAGAQRPLWIIRNNELEEIKADKFSIGGIQSGNEKKFTKHILSLSKDDCIYIFSDGFADQFGGPEGKKFMSKQLKNVLLANHTLPILEQENILNKTIESWKGGREQIDDILIIGIKI